MSAEQGGGGGGRSGACESGAGIARSMPPVGFGVDFGGGVALLEHDKSSSSLSGQPAACSTVDPHELLDCFKLHQVWFIVGFSAAALVLCCCVVLLARCYCCKGGAAAAQNRTMRDILSPLERDSFRQGLMRQSQWSKSTSTQQPLLRAAAADESDQSLSPSTKLLAASPLIRSQLREPGSNLGTVRSWLTSLSGVRKGADELITDANFGEVRGADGWRQSMLDSRSMSLLRALT